MQLDEMGRVFGRICRILAAGLLTLAVSGRGADAFEAEDLVFATADGSRDIVALDTISDRVVRRYSLPRPPRQVLVAREAGRLVVLHSIEPGFEVYELRLAAGGAILAAGGVGAIAIIDVGRGDVRSQIAIPGKAGSMIFDKGGAFLFVGDAGRDQIHMIDLQRDGNVETLDLDRGTNGRAGIAHLARTPGGSTAMAVDGAGNAVVLDLAARKVAMRLSLPGRQERIFPTVNSQYFLIPNSGDASVSIVSTWTHRESDRLRMRADVSSLNTVLADTVLFAFDENAQSVEVFDLDRRRRHADIPLSGRPSASVVGPGGLKLYVAFRDRPQIAVIDARTLRVVREIAGIGFASNVLVNGGKLSFCH
jgi:DNA-binding beta-propeller fold protein YncE